MSDVDLVLERHLAAIADRDLAALTATIAENIVLITGDRQVLEGKEIVTQFHEEWFDDPDWTFTPQPLYRVEMKYATTVGLAVEYADVDHDGEPVHMHYVLSLTFAEQPDGNWLLTHDQNTF